MLLAVDHRSPVPLQRQLYDAVRSAILGGRLRPGDRVPATRGLATTLGISRVTAALAYEQLVAEGYLDTKRGGGTFVSTHLPEGFLTVPRPEPDADAPSAPIRLSRYSRRLRRDPIADVAPRHVIDLARFSPDFDAFPMGLWRRLVARQLRGTGSGFFHYSPEAGGYPALREAIARYVMRSRAVRCDPSQVIVVNGSQQALDLCARVLIDPGETVVVEEPGYPGARNLFAAHGARLRPVPVDDEGIRVQELGQTARLAYVTPSHQFPTGASMSLPRRMALLAWARAHQAVIIEDDFDSEYRYRGAPIPSLQSCAPALPVIYIGTFSKVMFPGMRLGYLVVPRSLVAAFEDAKWIADRHTSVLEQAALAEFIGQGHLERHVRRMRRLYASRRAALVDALRRAFGDGVAVRGDEAGTHVVVRFRRVPKRLGTDAAGVRVASTAKYYRSAPPPNEFVFGFSSLSERSIREGVRRLAGR